MPWFWPISVLDHCANFFFSSYHRVSIVWTITDLVSHYPFSPSYTVAKFFLILWTCPAKLIFPPLDPSWPSGKITCDRPSEEAPFWYSTFPEAPRTSQGKSSLQFPLILGFMCLLSWAFSMASLSLRNMPCKSHSTSRSSVAHFSSSPGKTETSLVPSSDWREEDWFKCSSWRTGTP